MTALAYPRAYAPSLVTKPRDTAALIVSGALLQMMLLRGNAPTSNSFAQPVPILSTRSAPPIVIKAAAPAATTAEAVLELRRVSGLTWDEIADVFGVSRRAAHHWASGKAMTAAHIQHLFTVLHLVRRLHSGSSDEVRATLLAPSGSGVSGLGLLRIVNGENAERTFAVLAVARDVPVVKANLAEGLGPPLDAVLSTLEDRPIRSGRPSRIAKPMRSRKAGDPS